jgi:SAM-dependent methyltransferase
MEVDGGERSLDRSRVIQQISPDDAMIRWPPLGGGRKQYFALGEEAARIIQNSMRAAGAGPPRTILDFGCGHGRVLRMLKAAFPEARLTAADIDHLAVNFCVETFGAEPIYSSMDSHGIPPDKAFDLIWCGSLLTHVNADRIIGFLRLFDSRLAPDGIVVFTTSGRGGYEVLRDLLPDRKPDEVAPASIDKARQYFPLPDEILPDFASSYEREGFAYRDLAEGADYGTSLTSPAWVCRQVERSPHLRLVNYMERGWGSMQDVVACQRRE